MKISLFITIIFSSSVLYANSFNVNDFQTKKELFQKLSQVEEFKIKGVVEVPYIDKAVGKPLIKLIDTSEAEGDSHSNSKQKESYITDLGVDKVSTLDYYDTEKKQVFRGYKIGDFLVCFTVEKKQLLIRTWIGESKFPQHCFIFPKSIENIVEVLKAYDNPSHGAR